MYVFAKHHLVAVTLGLFFVLLGFQNCSDVRFAQSKMPSTATFNGGNILPLTDEAAPEVPTTALAPAPPVAPATPVTGEICAPAVCTKYVTTAAEIRSLPDYGSGVICLMNDLDFATVDGTHLFGNAFGIKTFDGCGHRFKNLTLANGGLAKIMSGSTIRNLTVEIPNANYGPTTAYVGSFAEQMINVTIDNVHIIFGDVVIDHQNPTGLNSCALLTGFSDSFKITNMSITARSASINGCNQTGLLSGYDFTRAYGSLITRLTINVPTIQFDNFFYAGGLVGNMFKVAPDNGRTVVLNDVSVTGNISAGNSVECHGFGSSPCQAVGGIYGNVWEVLKPLAMINVRYRGNILTTGVGQGMAGVAGASVMAGGVGGFVGGYFYAMNTESIHTISGSRFDGSIVVLHSASSRANQTSLSGGLAVGALAGSAGVTLPNTILNASLNIDGRFSTDAVGKDDSAGSAECVISGVRVPLNTTKKIYLDPRAMLTTTTCPFAYLSCLKNVAEFRIVNGTIDFSRMPVNYAGQLSKDTSAVTGYDSSTTPAMYGYLRNAVLPNGIMNPYNPYVAWAVQNSLPACTP